MRREGPKVPKFHWLARIGPKNVLQTRSEPASHLRASDKQKKKSVFSSTLGWSRGAGSPSHDTVRRSSGEFLQM